MAWMARSQPGATPISAAWDARRPGESDDTTLVAAAQVDRRAFAPLYDRYARLIYRYCYARLGSHEAAEDATGEVFLKALAALERYRDQAFAAWIFRIAHNVTTDVLRARRPTAPLDAAHEVPDPTRPPDELTLARDDRAAVRAALAALPNDQRAAVELQLAGWSGHEIAMALDRSPEAVRMLRLRAFNRLRKLLQ